MPFVPITYPSGFPIDREDKRGDYVLINLITAFCNEYRPEVVIHRPSGDYQCIIKGEVMGVGVTFMGALWNARYHIQNKD